MTTRLHGLTWEHPRGSGSLRGATAQWVASRPDVEVTWDARSLHDFGDEPLARRAGSYDLLVIDHPHVPDGHGEGWLLPLDGTDHDAELVLLATQAVGCSHESYRHGGHQYGLATDAAAHVSVHRPDLLPEPPTTWREVLALAASGRVLWPAKPVDAMASFLTISAQLGRPVIDDRGVVAADTALEALDLMRELAALVPAACLEESPIDIAERLSTSDEWWYAPLLFGYTNYSRQGFRPHRLCYRDMPADDAGNIAGSCLGGAGIAVSATTLEPALATDLAFWLAGAEAQTGCYFESGGQPGNAVAWEDESCNAATLDFFRGTRATLEGASVRPRWPGWLDVQTETGVLVNRCLRGELSAAEAVGRVQTSVDRVLTGVLQP